MQGPVASLRIEEVSLGRTKGAKKLYNGLARAAASARWRLPFMVRGVHVVLRNVPAEAKSSSRRRASWRGPRLFTGLLSQILLKLLPLVPVRIKDVTITHEVSVIHALQIEGPLI